MKKIVGGIVVILILAGLGSPFICGLVMERIVRETFNNLNQVYVESGHDVSVEIVRYDRGFSSSEIEWRIKFGRLKALYDIDEVVFVDRAEHGLSGIVTKTSLEKNKWYSDFVAGKLAGKDPLHITTTYKMTGGIATTTAVDAFAIEAEQETFTIKPGSFTLVCDKEFRKFASEASWEGMAVADKLTMNGISLKSDLTRISSYIWDGQAHFVMQSVKAKGEGDIDQMELANLKVDYLLSYNKERNTLSAKAEYGADSITAGPEKIGNIFARLGVSGLDAGRFEEFMKLYTATMNGFLAEMANAKDDPEKMKVLMEKQMATIGFQLVAAGEKLLTKGLEFQISDLHLQLPEGEIKGDVTLSLKKDMTLAEFMPVVNQPELALDILFLKSAASLPEKLVGDAPMLFAPLYPGMQTGLFIKSGDNVQHSAETRDGKLFLNDKEVVLK
ncbi:MAG: hypothetical protein ACD_75C01150G0001 [uncultured bacterium]|nr:MAG: hypothetical protein ACD_75C01150G0001 [uncultured bacterium]